MKICKEFKFHENRTRRLTATAKKVWILNMCEQTINFEISRKTSKRRVWEGGIF